MDVHNKDVKSDRKHQIHWQMIKLQKWSCFPSQRPVVDPCNSVLIPNTCRMHFTQKFSFSRIVWDVVVVTTLVISKTILFFLLYSLKLDWRSIDINPFILSMTRIRMYTTIDRVVPLLCDTSSKRRFFLHDRIFN